MQPAGWVQRLWRGRDPARPSRLAWAVFTLGVAAFMAALAAGLLHRWGAIRYGTGFLILRYAAIASLAALVLGSVALARAATGARRRGWGWAALGVVLAAAWLPVPLYYVTVLLPGNPRIHDITTDLEHPPAFVAILPLRASAANSADYGGPAVAERQRQFFPTLAPVRSAKPPAEVFPAALEAARGLGLEIVAAVPEQGRIEATQRTLFFGFVDDVVIRVRPDGAGTRVDVRSVSRVGGSDLGANARRVRRYVAALTARLGG